MGGPTWALGEGGRGGGTDSLLHASWLKPTMAGLVNAGESGWELGLVDFFREPKRIWVVSAEGVGHWFEGNPRKGVGGCWTRYEPARPYSGWAEWRRGVRGLNGGSSVAVATVYGRPWLGDATGE